MVGPSASAGGGADDVDGPSLGVQALRPNRSILTGIARGSPSCIRSTALDWISPSAGARLAPSTKRTRRSSSGSFRATRFGLSRLAPAVRSRTWGLLVFALLGPQDQRLGHRVPDPLDPLVVDHPAGSRTQHLCDLSDSQGGRGGGPVPNMFGCHRCHPHDSSADFRAASPQRPHGNKRIGCTPRDMTFSIMCTIALSIPGLGRALAISSPPPLNPKTSSSPNPLAATIARAGGPLAY